MRSSFLMARRIPIIDYYIFNIITMYTVVNLFDLWPEAKVSDTGLLCQHWFRWLVASESIIQQMNGQLVCGVSWAG